MIELEQNTQGSAAAMREENNLEATMNAVIIYDDFTCATKAKAMFERAAHRAEEALLWIVKPWRLDMLSVSTSAEAALADAADAHLILFGLRNPQSLPPWLQSWLEQWAKRRQVQDAALAVWDGENGEVLSAFATPVLSEFAARYGLSFIFSDVSADEDESAGFVHALREQEVFVTPTLKHILHCAPDHPYGQGGIND